MYLKILLDMVRDFLLSISPAMWLEIFGYTGTVLVVVSMMMKSLTKLRIVNMSGSVISAIYAGICGAWPIVVMNICLFAINGFHLIKAHKKQAISNIITVYRE